MTAHVPPGHVGTSPLIRKLLRYTSLSADDIAALEHLTRDRIRQAAARTDIIVEGDAPDHVNLFLSGWACRYKVLEDGRRQIVGLLLPGDFCDFNCFYLRRMDHSVGAIATVTYASLPRDLFERMTTEHPAVAKAMWKDTLATVATQREWTLNLGQRNAYERVAHLFCELYRRLHVVGLTDAQGYSFPLTQADIAEAMGISNVHANRTLQALRSAGLISLSGKSLTIPDLAALQTAGLFSADYLHLDE